MKVFVLPLYNITYIQPINELSLSKVSLEHEMRNASKFQDLGIFLVAFLFHSEVKLRHKEPLHKGSFCLVSMEMKHWYVPK